MSTGASTSKDPVQKATSCRCGENKTSTKPSCKSSKRCPCFVNSKPCLTCKCKCCENPFGQNNPSTDDNKSAKTQRQIDTTKSRAGHLSRNFHDSEFGDVKSDWNLVEKILIKRIARQLKEKGLSADSVFRKYLRCFKKAKSKNLREKQFSEVQVLMKKMNLN